MSLVVFVVVVRLWVFVSMLGVFMFDVNKWLSVDDFGVVVDVVSSSRVSLRSANLVSDSLLSTNSSVISGCVSHALDLVLGEKSVGYVFPISVEKLGCWVNYALFGCSSCVGVHVSDDVFSFLVSVLRRSHDRLYGCESHYGFCGGRLSVDELHSAVSHSLSVCTVIDELGFVSAVEELVSTEAVVEFVCDLLQLERAWLVS